MFPEIQAIELNEKVAYLHMKRANGSGYRIANDSNSKVLDPAFWK